jgi:hypothetical protein
MTQVLDSNTYGLFFEAADDLANPYSDTYTYLESNTKPLGTQSNMFHALFKVCDKINNVESTNSLTSLSSHQSMSSLQSESDLINVQSFFKAFEVLSIPKSDSTAALQEIPRVTSVTTPGPLRSIFQAFEEFLHNES